MRKTWFMYNVHFLYCQIIASKQDAKLEQFNKENGSKLFVITRNGDVRTAMTGARCTAGEADETLTKLCRRTGLML